MTKNPDFSEYFVLLNFPRYGNSNIRFNNFSYKIENDLNYIEIIR